MRTNSSTTPLVSNPLVWLVGAIGLLLLLGGCAPSSKVRYEKLVFGAADPQPAANNIVALAFRLDENGNPGALALASVPE